MTMGSCLLEIAFLGQEVRSSEVNLFGKKRKERFFGNCLPLGRDSSHSVGQERQYDDASTSTLA